MSNKLMRLNDNTVIKKDNINLFSNGLRGHVIFKDPITGKTLLEKDNKVVISGSMLTACALFDKDPWVDMESYNVALGLENAKERATFNSIPDFNGKKQKSNILLFCGGASLNPDIPAGCGSENSQVYDVNYAGRIHPSNLVPFRYVNPSPNELNVDQSDLDPEMRDKYVGRKVDSTTGRIAYYFKTFENEGTGICRFLEESGTTTDISDSSEIYNATTIKNAETFIELNLQITKEDFRDYFRANNANSLSLAHINCISLCSAWREIIDGHTVYQDITPVTQLNIPNESLVDTSKGIDITYQIFL